MRDPAIRRRQLRFVAGGFWLIIAMFALQWLVEAPERATTVVLMPSSEIEEFGDAWRLWGAPPGGTWDPGAVIDPVDSAPLSRVTRTFGRERASVSIRWSQEWGAALDALAPDRRPGTETAVDQHEFLPLRSGTSPIVARTIQFRAADGTPMLAVALGVRPLSGPIEGSTLDVELFAIPAARAVPEVQVRVMATKRPLDHWDRKLGKSPYCASIEVLRTGAFEEPSPPEKVGVSRRDER